MADNATKSMDEIMALCKRRGFIFQASEIYGGINGFWDYGPLGAQLKKNLRDAWWQDMIMVPCWGQNGPNGEPVRSVPVETRIIQHPKVWEASGHIGGFNDPMVDDTETKQRFRADHLYGAFVFDGDTLSDVLEHQQQQLLEFAVIPRCTVIASGVDEAADLIASEPKRLKPYSIEHLEPHPMDPSLCIGKVVRKDGDPLSLVVARITKDHYSRYLDKIPSPFTGKAGCLTPPRQFNLMFHSYTGATATEDDKVYLRPETAQGIFVQFKNVVDTTRVKVPFGIGNTGTSFRNEVTPRNYTFRSREFEQAELEFFCAPDESAAWYKFWRDFRMAWWESIGLAGENLVLREHDADELSHYSTGTSDVEYKFPFTAPGYGELEGIAHRGCFDLTQHAEHSGAKLEYFDTELQAELQAQGLPKEEINARCRYMPHVIEPAAGLDRGVLALICEAFTPDPDRASGVYMKFHPRIAPIKAAVFPLVKKDGMPEIAAPLAAELRRKFGHLGTIEYDEKQSIGKRYARMDEAGCPFCFTVDSETLTDRTVTVRDRDTLEQSRIGIDEVAPFLAGKLGL